MSPVVVTLFCALTGAFVLFGLACFIEAEKCARRERAVRVSAGIARALVLKTKFEALHTQQIPLNNITLRTSGRITVDLRDFDNRTDAERRRDAIYAASEIERLAAEWVAMNKALNGRRAPTPSVPLSVATAHHMAALTMGLTMRSSVEIKPILIPLPTMHTTEAVIGYRLWEVRDAGPLALLESVASRTLWPVGKPLVAHELAGDHTGIHAFKRELTPEEYLESYGITEEKRGNIIVGKVSLWGRIIEHENGYRAEFAYPHTLRAPSEELAQALRRTYGCETTFEPNASR